MTPAATAPPSPARASNDVTPKLSRATTMTASFFMPYPFQSPASDYRSTLPPAYGQGPAPSCSTYGTDPRNGTAWEGLQGKHLDVERHDPLRIGSSFHRRDAFASNGEPQDDPQLPAART